MKKSSLLLPVILLALVSSGCVDNPVTIPDGQPLVFTGLLREGGTVEEILTLEEEGTVRIELTKATAVLFEVLESGAEPIFTIGIGIGDLSSGACALTFGNSLEEGASMTVLMEDKVRCLAIFDDGSLPEDAVVSYVVTVEDV